MSQSNTSSPTNRAIAFTNQENERMRTSDENERDRLLAQAANSGISIYLLAEIVLASQDEDVTVVQLGDLVTTTIRDNSPTFIIRNAAEHYALETNNLSPEERQNARRAEVERRATTPSTPHVLTVRGTNRLAAIPRVIEVIQQDNSNIEIEIEEEVERQNSNNRSNASSTSRSEEPEDLNEISRILNTAANNLNINQSQLETLVAISRNANINPVQLRSILMSILQFDLGINEIQDIENDYATQTRSLTTDEREAQRAQQILYRINNPQPPVELTETATTRLTTAIHAIDNPSNSSSNRANPSNSSSNSEINTTTNSEPRMDDVFIPKEPSYDRNMMKNLDNMDFTDDLDQVLENINIYESKPSCLIFEHNVSIDQGGLAKEWFAREYTSLKIIIFIYNSDYFEEIFHHSENSINNYNFYNYVKWISKIIILGYINFRWLYISDDLLDFLYISYKLRKPKINSKKYYENIYYELFTSYVIRITSDVLAEFTDDLSDVDENLVELIKFMKKKVQNKFNPTEHNNYINRKYLIAYLYYLEYIDAEKKNYSDRVKKYYLLKIVKILYQNKDNFIDQIKYIDENLNIDTAVNLLTALKARISHEIPFETFLKKYEEIYLYIKEFLPDTEALNEAYAETRNDTYPYFLQTKNKQLLYAHLLNNNEVVDINKLLSIIEFSDSDNIVFTNIEKNKLLDIIRSMNNIEALNFLKFVTGTDRIPPIIRILKTNTERLVSHTCTDQLEFPVNFITVNDNESIKIALTTEFTYDFTIAGGGTIVEKNTMSNTINSIFLAGIVLVSSIFQSM